MSTSFPLPLRGDIWRVDLNPVIGSEMSKQRPVVVISSDAIGRLPVKLVAPITGWQPHFTRNVWHVRISPTPTNGLTKLSAADVLQVRGVDTQRFVARLGQVPADTLDEIVAALALVVEYQ